MTGCGGTKLLSEPNAIDLDTPLVSIESSGIRISLLGVIVNNGPGAWARNTDWDKYLLSIENLSESEIVISQINLKDFLGNLFEPSADRKTLVSLSYNQIDRYENGDLEVTSGIGAGTVLATGAAVAVVGAAAAVPAATMGGAAAIGTGPVLVAGAVLLSPVFVVAGLRRMSNTSKVSRVIETRASELPQTIGSGEEVLVDVFYP